MATMTDITIESAHVRRVVTFALWRIVSADIVGERELSEDFYDLAWRGIHSAYQLYGGLGEAEHRLIRIGAVRAATRAVAAAGDGERLPLPVAPEELADALHDCMQAIDQNVDVLISLSPEERADVVACRSAARRLLRLLGEASAPAKVERDVSVPEFSGAPMVRRTRTRPGERVLV